MECACGIRRTGSRSSTSTLSVVCVVDGSMPLLLPALGFLEFLKQLSHFYQFLLQFIPVVHGMIKILCEAVLNHSSNHLSIILCDCIVRWWSLSLRFLACTCFLYCWSLSSPWFLCDGVRCGFLCSLSRFSLSIGRLSGLCPPLLGP